MSDRRVFVIVPSLVPAGPVKGAVALCNGLSEQYRVTLVALKPLTIPGLDILPSVELLLLGAVHGWKARCLALRGVLSDAGGRNKVTSISYCFSPDMMNLLMKKYARIVSSVRGNLPQIYRFDYGRVGVPLAYAHLLTLRRFDAVTAMSDVMVNQLRALGLKRVALIGNFIDERSLEQRRRAGPHDNSPVRFVFLASLTRRKRPDMLVDAVDRLRDGGIMCSLDIVGDGELRPWVESRIAELGLGDRIRLCGHLDNPYDVVQSADCMVLPSEAEGVARAVLEGLFFGLWCILSDVDANSEVVDQGVNGELFSTDEELVNAMAWAATHLPSLRRRNRASLLAERFRQSSNIERFTEIIGD